MTDSDHEEVLARRAEEVLGPPVRVPARDRIPREDIITLRKRGYSLPRIGEYYGVSHMTIWRILGPLDIRERMEIQKAQSKVRAEARSG